jgi:hypothetical protein
MKSIISYAVLALAILAFSTVSISGSAYAADGHDAFSQSQSYQDAASNDSGPSVTDDGQEISNSEETFAADKGSELCDDSHYVCIIDPGQKS